MLKEFIEYLMGLKPNQLPITIEDPKPLDQPYYALVKDGFKVQELAVDRFLKHPRSTTASVIVKDAASFLEYWSLHANEASQAFADLAGAKIGAVIDYHKDKPGWCKHLLNYHMTATPEWSTWLASDGKKMNQEDFARFIEDNAADIFNPPSMAMRELALTLEASTDSQFTSSVNLQNGQRTLQYTQEMKSTVGKSKLEVPEFFTLRLVPYWGAMPTEIVARFRFRINGDGKLTLWYDLLRPHKVTEEAILAQVAVIEKATSRKVLIGNVTAG